MSNDSDYQWASRESEQQSKLAARKEEARKQGWEPVPDFDRGVWVIDQFEIPLTSELTALLVGFKNHDEPRAREYYFWRIAEILWDQPGRECLLDCHPWAELIIAKACRNKYLAIGGAASSGKSHIMAAWGIVQWMCAPDETLVLMTSTTLREARKRIWGSVISLLSVVEGLPLKIRDSIGSANYIDQQGRIFDRMGLSLIAAERSKTREAIGKLIGIHTPRVILIGDELTELSPSITEAAMSNLNANPYFQFVGLSNPASRFDAFGSWSEPKGGWDSIVPDRDLRWATKYGGEFIRLDASDSPNVKAGTEIYPYLPTAEKIEEAKMNLGGENSRGFMRMFRAVFFDGGEEDGIYSEAEIVGSGALGQCVFSGRTTKVAAVDPSFSSGGDRTILITGELGYNDSNQFALQFKEVIPIFEDETNKAVTRTVQICRQIKEICKARGIAAMNVAVDSTGAGSPFCDALAGEWNNEFLRINFGGAATERRVSVSNRTPAKELYFNRVSEMWFVGKEFLRCKQLFGVPHEMAVDMTARQYELRKLSTLRMKIESKEDFNSRMGRSPDISDAAFLLVDLARERHSFVAMEPTEHKGASLRWARPERNRKDLDVATRSVHAHLPDV